MMFGRHDGNAIPCREFNEYRCAETLMTHFKRMAQRNPVLRRRQHRQKITKIIRIELLGRRELPQQRPQVIAKFRYA